jgi:trk system potassium uptake protein
MKVRSFMVIGAGRFGSALARTLFDLGHEVVIVDRDEAALEAVMAHATQAVVLDAGDEETLGRLGPGNFDAVVVAIGESFEGAVLAVAAAKALGARRIVAKATSQLAAQVLAKVGADEVVRPEHDSGVRLARHLVTPALVDAFELGENSGVVEIEAGPDLVGTLAHLRLTNRFHVQVIAVARGERLTAAPKADFEVVAGDRLVVIGATDDLDRFREALGG